MKKHRFSKIVEFVIEIFHKPLSNKGLRKIITVQVGLRRSVERGKKLGRPKARMNPEEIKRLRGEGLSFAEIASRVCYNDRNGRKRSISKTQVSRILNGGK